MPSFQAAGNTENLLFFVSLHPSPCLSLSLCLYPSVPVPQLRSFHHFYLSLVCCTFSPHRFTSPRFPLAFSPSLPLSMLLFSCTLHPVPSPLPPSCYLSLTPSFFFHCHSLHHSVCPSSCHHASCRFLSTCHILCFAGYSKFVTLSHSFFMSCVSSLLHDAII